MATRFGVLCSHRRVKKKNDVSFVWFSNVACVLCSLVTIFLRIPSVLSLAFSARSVFPTALPRCIPADERIYGHHRAVVTLVCWSLLIFSRPAAHSSAWQPMSGTKVDPDPANTDSRPYKGRGRLIIAHTLARAGQLLCARRGTQPTEEGITIRQQEVHADGRRFTADGRDGEPLDLA